MRDFLPEDVRRRAYVLDVVTDVYERYGFEPLETPAVENIETLLGKYGDEGNRLIFKILKRGEHEQTGQADLALRYDLTVPLARVVAEYRGTLPKFFKRYQIQPVWRADRPARGRFREFYQCDVDAIGSTSPVVEVEVCAAVSDVLERLGFGDFTIRLNHREVLRGLLDGAGVPETLHDTALVAIDKLDKIGASGVVEELVARGVGPGAARQALEAFTATGDASNEAVLARLSTQIGSHASATDGLHTLRAILQLSQATSAGPLLRLDPSLARGLSYYTGAIFEVAVDGIGSLGGGGRYDNLVGMFSSGSVPACGFSLGLERILVVMSERGMFPASVTRSSADVLATVWNADALTDTLALARLLRAAGLRVEVYPDADKIGKQMKYASSRGVRFATIVGDDEQAAGTVMVKDLTTGGQTPVPRGEVAAWLSRRLQSQSA
ncbi:MAG: histidine--tRNA ligase [Vicinamibacteria bacterium]|nr:histidine--tRNA ligase [Vicinamibacteria bacterium]